MYAYIDEFYETGVSWKENLWSLRLAGCLSYKILKDKPYNVKYTATKKMSTSFKHSFLYFMDSPIY